MNTQDTPKFETSIVCMAKGLGLGSACELPHDGIIGVGIISWADSMIDKYMPSETDEYRREWINRGICASFRERGISI